MAFAVTPTRIIKVGPTSAAGIIKYALCLLGPRLERFTFVVASQKLATVNPRHLYFLLRGLNTSLIFAHFPRHHFVSVFASVDTQYIGQG